MGFFTTAAQPARADVVNLDRDLGRDGHSLGLDIAQLDPLGSAAAGPWTEQAFFEGASPTPGGMQELLLPTFDQPAASAPYRSSILALHLEDGPLLGSDPEDDTALARAIAPQYFDPAAPFALQALPLESPITATAAQSVEAYGQPESTSGRSFIDGRTSLPVASSPTLMALPQAPQGWPPVSAAESAADDRAAGSDLAYQVIATPPPIPMVTVPSLGEDAAAQAEPSVFNPADRFPYPAAIAAPTALAGIEVIEDVPSGLVEIAQSPLPDARPADIPVTEAAGAMAQAVETTPVSSQAADLANPNRALTDPILNFQAAFLYQDDDLSARGRLTGIYPITSYLLVGGSLDLTEGDAFVDSELEGVNINELYVTVAPPSIPNLRFTLGQVDLTSYFDRNSFAKDAVTHFFNPIFQTNPALATSGLGSRQGIVANWAVTDDVRLAVSGFSSDRSISEFELDAVATELGVRVGNGIIRATYINGQDSGADDGPADIFSLDRGDGDFGIEEGDREEAFGLNAEYFIPEINLGLFARYGHYNNRDADFDADTISGGFNFLDVFIDRDRLGLAYGQNLLGSDDDDIENTDALELFYDIPIRRNLRAGFSLQQRDDFSETVVGFRIRSDFNILP
ncbi:MAG: hypothetical protein ACFB5Z_05450 [Elainellaceae cyanobacterium]